MQPERPFIDRTRFTWRMHFWYGLHCLVCPLAWRFYPERADIFDTADMPWLWRLNRWVAEGWIGPYLRNATDRLKESR
jgi:hypothetical protein